MLAEHGKEARDYPDVRANTVASFALGDYEWILAFEADELHRIVDLMRHLRGQRGAPARARGDPVLHRHPTGSRRARSRTCPDDRAERHARRAVEGRHRYRRGPRDVHGDDHPLPGPFRVGEAAAACVAATTLAAAELIGERGGDPGPVDVHTGHAAEAFRSERTPGVVGGGAAGCGRRCPATTGPPTAGSGCTRTTRTTPTRSAARWAPTRRRARRGRPASGRRGRGRGARGRRRGRGHARPATAGSPTAPAPRSVPSRWWRSSASATPRPGRCRRSTARARTGSSPSRPSSTAPRRASCSRCGPGRARADRRAGARPDPRDRRPGCDRDARRARRRRPARDRPEAPGARPPGDGHRLRQALRATSTSTPRRARHAGRLAATPTSSCSRTGPGSLARKGFGPSSWPRGRPGIVVVSLCAYGHTGPWRGRRGFDSLVQMSCGIAADGAWTAREPLPAQALDHGTGWLAAYGVLTALRRPGHRGRLVARRLSLARTAEWLHDLGRDDPALRRWTRRPLLTETDSDFGRCRTCASRARGCRCAVPAAGPATRRLADPRNGPRTRRPSWTAHRVCRRACWRSRRRRPLSTTAYRPRSPSTCWTAIAGWSLTSVACRPGSGSASPCCRPGRWPTPAATPIPRPPGGAAPPPG